MEPPLSSFQMPFSASESPLPPGSSYCFLLLYFLCQKLHQLLAGSVELLGKLIHSNFRHANTSSMQHHYLSVSRCFMIPLQTRRPGLPEMPGILFPWRGKRILIRIKTDGHLVILAHIPGIFLVLSDASRRRSQARLFLSLLLSPYRTLRLPSFPPWSPVRSWTGLYFDSISLISLSSIS